MVVCWDNFVGHVDTTKLKGQLFPKIFMTICAAPLQLFIIWNLLPKTIKNQVAVEYSNIDQMQKKFLPIFHTAMKYLENERQDKAIFTNKGPYKSHLITLEHLVGFINTAHI